MRFAREALDVAVLPLQRPETDDAHAGGEDGLRLRAELAALGLGWSVTLGKKGTLLGAWTIFSGAATQKRQKGKYNF